MTLGERQRALWMRNTSQRGRQAADESIEGNSSNAISYAVYMPNSKEVSFEALFSGLGIFWQKSRCHPMLWQYLQVPRWVPFIVFLLVCFYSGGPVDYPMDSQRTACWFSRGSLVILGWFFQEIFLEQFGPWFFSWIFFHDSDAALYI